MKFAVMKPETVQSGIAPVNMITLLLDSSGIGGIETHVATLFTALQHAGQPCEILFLKDHGENPFHAQLRSKEIPFAILKGGLLALVRRLKANKTSVLHTHGYKAGIIGRLAATMARRPVVSTFHAGERAPLPVGLYQRLDEWTSCLSENIAVSAPIARHLPFGGTLIPNFILVPEMGETPHRHPQIGFVGRLSAEKAPDRFCEIAKRLKGQADFHLFGDGPMRAALEDTYAGDVQFHGLQTDMDTVWAQLDLLVMPSRAEGLPMAALEAIARGIPLVAAEVGALNDVVDVYKAGWLIAASDDAEVINGSAEAIRQWLALDAHEKDTLRHSAHGHAKARFGERHAIEAVLAVYQKAMQRKG